MIPPTEMYIKTKQSRYFYFYKADTCIIYQFKATNFFNIFTIVTSLKKVV